MLSERSWCQTENHTVRDKEEGMERQKERAKKNEQKKGIN